MIANYGYRDGSGEYYLTIDTDRCIDCGGRWCVQACPRSLFEIEADDYDDEVATIVMSARKQLKETCADCKPSGGYETLPCTTACLPAAITHSW
jgi:ferredoxin